MAVTPFAINLFSMKFKIFAVTFLLASFTLQAQRQKNIFSIGAGFHVVNMGIEEADFRDIHAFRNGVGKKKNFTSTGYEVSISQPVSSRLTARVSWAHFNSEGYKFKEEGYLSYSYYYTLKGDLIPLTLEYRLSRNPSTRLQLFAGGGLQLIKFKMSELERSSLGIGSVITQFREFKKSEFGILAVPGLNYRLIGQVYSDFHLRMGYSFSGRVTFNPSISLNYMFGKSHS